MAVNVRIDLQYFQEQKKNVLWSSQPYANNHQQCPFHVEAKNKMKVSERVSPYGSVHIIIMVFLHAAICWIDVLRMYNNTTPTKCIAIANVELCAKLFENICTYARIFRSGIRMTFKVENIMYAERFEFSVSRV